MPQERPLRADAARNRGKIMEAANRQIIAHGPDVPMEAIAEDAGVAVGTLYRHFPTKADLVRAVLDLCLGEIAADAEAAADRIAAGASALDEFIAFSRMVMENAADNKAVKAAARALGTPIDEGEHAQQGRDAMDRIIAAGKAEGSLRPDLTVDDGYLFFATVPIDQPLAIRERWFTLMMDGFRSEVERSADAPDRG
ncbi:MAG TPA: helix-turn-helix domain-containing protein [Glycomyces sp.]|nr:helix-turn-helix domain-containing protein [Glycomyces sp.]